MAIKFNPLTGNFDFTGSGGGGGSAFFAGEVATYADLPLDGTAALNSRWLVRGSSGTWPFPNYRQGGIYVRTSTVGANRDDDYLLADTNFPDVFSDAAFTIYDDSDATKNVKFDVGGLTAGTTRTLTVPNSSGTISLTGHTHIASDIVFGQFSNDRIDWNSPNPIGSGTPQDGIFTNLTANTALVLKDGTGNETATFDAQGKLSANRTYALTDRSGAMVLSDTSVATGADAVTNIVSLTQAEYNAIGSPDAATLFLITDP